MGVLSGEAEDVRWISAGNEVQVQCSPAGLRVVRWGALSAAQRAIAHDTLPLFSALLEALKSQPRDRWLAVLEYSRAVGLVLGRPQTVELTLESAGQDGGTHALNLAAWELLEACFVDQAPVRGSLAGSLVAWIQRNGPAASTRDQQPSLASALRRLLAAADAAPRPEELAEFWPIAARLVALGWTRACCELLQRHSVWGEWRLRKPSAQPTVAAIEAVERLLARAPQPGAAEAQLRLQEWRGAVAALLAASHVWAPLAGSATGEGLRSLVRVLAGEEEAIVSAAVGWRELFFAQLCHVYPLSSSRRELLRVAAASMSRMRVQAQTLAPLDEVLMACIDGDAAECVRICSAHLDSWFNAHAPDLLAAGGGAAEALVCSPLPGGDGSSVMQWYRLEYATACAAAPALQHVAAEYLAACGPAGGACLRRAQTAKLTWPVEEALRAIFRAPGADERAALRTLALARRFAPPEVAADVCAAKGKAAEVAGSFGCSLQWYRRGDCAAGLSRILDQGLLRQCPWAAPEPSRMSALLACMSAEEGCSGPLSPAAYYAALQASIGKAAAAVHEGLPQEVVRAHECAAAAALRSLLQEPDVPRTLWPAALGAAVPLLECPGGVLDEADTHLLASRLMELQVHPWASVELDDVGEAQVSALQLALARSFARAACA